VFGYGIHLLLQMRQTLGKVVCRRAVLVSLHVLMINSVNVKQRAEGRGMVTKRIVTGLEYGKKNERR
jgi:hypothetical protein